MITNKETQQKNKDIEINISKIEKEIHKIKQELLEISDMRSGSLTQQYHDAKNKTGGYWSLSYTQHMRGKTESVHLENLEQTRKQIVEYKKFKELTARWIDLAKELCQLKWQEQKAKKAKIQTEK